MVRDETRVHHLERVRRDFVSNVSHELRTPITAVQLIAETLANGGLDDPDAAAGFVRRIGQEASHMAQMVEELLELSTIESGLRPMARERVPIAGLMASLDRLRPLAESKGVSLDVSVAPETPDVFGDASHLGQVLRNLAHNAIKFTPSGGSITVSAIPGSDGHVVLRCRDTGVGITPADLPQDLRALLEGGQLPAARRRGLGARPRNRAARRRSPRRNRVGDLRASPRHRVPGRAPRCRGRRDPPRLTGLPPRKRVGYHSAIVTA